MPGGSRLSEVERLYVELQRKISAEWSRQLDRLLSGSQAAILSKLDAAGPQRISALADRLSVTPGAVTSLCDKLIAGGYAFRTRDDDDRRVVYLEITDRGREVLRQYRDEVKRVVEEAFAGLPEEETEHLARIFRHILSNLEKPKE
ncbi:hypothetical protein J31TS4_34570 [Paenibacillus sp. J31TS4]|uniref:MarR family winged helix-turn-helix transcriptional regulator n=1 Tax=Paenibacillus sp. J31TS4 TaxID=2807195 RepID=UPI001B2ADE55|nr:MarR family winged helix-turn-helix transcriptional regulator [Paenibacillus sp. J31TS4]GIP40177.1 hypothetical protein J31TS4_34570 [Paenibacillus sp. J31TS4]